IANVGFRGKIGKRGAIEAKKYQNDANQIEPAEKHFVAQLVAFAEELINKVNEEDGYQHCADKQEFSYQAVEESIVRKHVQSKERATESDVQRVTREKSIQVGATIFNENKTTQYSSRDRGERGGEADMN